MPQVINLGSEPWLTDRRTRKVVDALATGQIAVRFVGGCVRNALLDEPVTDIDLATVHPPDKVTELLTQAGLKAVPTGVAHGTITAVAEGKPFEITTLRADVETHGRRATVAFTTDWVEDAKRRDLTINAIYADPDGTLFDPVGGLDDIQHRRIRFIGDPEERIKEDYLRILRYFRFYAHYGEGPADAAAVEACTALKAGLRRLSGERIQMEFLKLLATGRAVESLRLMAAGGILTELLGVPFHLDEMARLAEIEKAHSFAPDAVLRLAALLGPSPEAVDAWVKRCKSSRALRDRLMAIASDDTPLRPDIPLARFRRLLYQKGRQLVQDRLMLTWAADLDAGRGIAWRALWEIAEAWERPVFPLTGAEIRAAGVPKGPEIGRVMRKLEKWWIDGDFAADKSALHEQLRLVLSSGDY